MDFTPAIFFASILIVGAILFAVITFRKGGARNLDVTKFRTKWLAIEQQLGRDDIASHQLVVLNADKLLDQALREKNVAGATMGERMKNSTWSNADAVWQAHKLRNRIAHESDVTVSYDDAPRTCWI
jgi:hypothetical protein